MTLLSLLLLLVPRGNCLFGLRLPQGPFPLICKGSRGKAPTACTRMCCARTSSNLRNVKAFLTLLQNHVRFVHLYHSTVGTS